VVLLMFSLGLEFSLRKLTRVGMAAFVAALLEITLMMWLGYEMGQLFGWNVLDSVFLGAMLSISSTTIIVKALAELGKTKEPFSEIIFGILVIEDMLAIVLLALLSGFATSGTVSVSMVGIEVLKLAVFFVLILIPGFIGVPRLFDYIAKFKNDEMMLITALGLCFGIALIATLLGYSVALGAFLIGAVIAESRLIHKIEGLIAPVRDMFSAIFFVTIGMLIVPHMLIEYFWPIVILSLLVIVGKVITCSFGAFVGGKDLHTSLCVGMGLAQIGEFSFIIATLGLAHGTSDFLYPIAVAVSVITTLATPYLIRGTGGFVGFLEHVMPRPLMQSLAVYTAWVGSFGKVAPSPTTLLIRQMSWQLLVNLLLTVGVFTFWAWVGELPTSDWPVWFQADAMQDIVCWLAAVVMTAWIYLASAQKIQSMSSLVAEVLVPRTSDGGHRMAARSLISQLFVLVSFTVMTFLTVLLSTSILGSFAAMLPLLLLVTVVALFFRRMLVRIYSRAEMALNETLLELPTFHETQPKVLPEILHEAELETMEIPVGSHFADQTLRDIPLRAQTGTSIVAIERGGQRMINPGPEEILLPGDRVLLLGHAEQLSGARELLSGTK